MSDRSRARVVCSLALATALLAVAPGATPAQDLATVRAHLVSSDRALLVARDSLHAIVDSLRNARIPRDSIRVGDLTLKYTAADMSASTHATLERAAAIAWREAEEGLGDGASRVARRMPIVVNRRRFIQRLEPRHVDFTLPGVPSLARTYLLPLDAAPVAAELLDLLGTVASLDEPVALQAYSGLWIPAARVTYQSWADAATDLATSNAAVARDCFAGLVSRCESALGLTAVSDSLTEWYSPEDWRVMVARRFEFRGAEPGRAGDRDECLSGRAPDVCEALVREQAIPRPLTTATRRTLLGLALELGGPKAYDRLGQARGTALEALAATAGLSGDRLVGEWRKRVLAATPHAVRPQLLEGTVMIGWTLLFAAAATRRRP